MQVSDSSGKEIFAEKIFISISHRNQSFLFYSTSAVSNGNEPAIHCLSFRSPDMLFTQNAILNYGKH